MKWIDATKETPEKNGSYLVVCEFGYTSYIPYYDGIWNSSDGSTDTEITDVKFWMDIYDAPAGYERRPDNRHFRKLGGHNE